MSAEAARRPSVPTNPRALAALIADHHTPDLFAALAAQVGRSHAVELWWQAADLLERHFPIPRAAHGPDADDVVWTLHDADHAPVPGKAVMACGLIPPVLFALNPPHGQPCDDCFGDDDA